MVLFVESCVCGTKEELFVDACVRGCMGVCYWTVICSSNCQLTFPWNCPCIRLSVG